MPHITYDNPTVLNTTMLHNTSSHIYGDIPTVFKNVPYGTQDIPNSTHNTPHTQTHGTEYTL